MNRHVIVAWIMVFLYFTLSGCAADQNPYLWSVSSKENWQQCLPSNPNVWKRGADEWFLKRDPCNLDFHQSQTETGYRTSAMSKMSVAVSDSLNTIKVDGGFQTQIYGTEFHNTVDVYGPSVGISSLTVDADDNGVYVHAHRDASPEIIKVIVRIGVKQLNNLVQMGCGPIDIIRITSPDLAITTTPQASGNIYLSGHVRLRQVIQGGSSRITVFGVDTRNLDIQTCGFCGGVNLWGNVGVRSIIHHGMNDINIIGANSPSLCIFADGGGTVAIKGFVRLGKVETHDHAHVYVSQTSSKLLFVSARDCSLIGLSGSVCNLYANTRDNAGFLAQSLCAQNVYACSHDCSHMNITASKRAFATAKDDSSIYFFGPSYLLTPFKSENGIVVPIEGRNFCNRASEFRDYDYTDAHCSPPRFVGCG